MILLTGATGFFGKEIVKKLRGNKLKCLVRNPDAASFLKKYGCSIAGGDITDKTSVQKAVKGADVVVHAAAVVTAKSNSDYERVNIQGTKNVVEAAKTAKVRHFVFISTILAAYPKSTPYSRSKVEGEAIVKDSGIPYTILRVSLVYNDNDTKTIGKLARIIRKSPVIPLVGSGRSVIQPVYAGDAASAIAAAASKKPSNKTYYLAGPPVVYRDMVKAIASQLKVRRLLLPLPLFILKPMMLVYSFLSRKSSFNARQLDFLTANLRFNYAPASEDLSFNPVDFSDGVKKLRKL